MPRSDTISLPRTLAAAAGLLLVAATPAWAHVGAGPAHGLAHGLTHPLAGADHLLAMVAVGLWAAQQGGRAALLLPATFVLSMVLGALLGGSGMALPGVEAGILASVLVLGALVAAAVRVRAGVGALVVALLAILHGHAHGTEMPATASGLAYGAGFVLATAALHGAGLLAGLGARRARGVRGTPLVRLAGAAIGLAGLALTAL